MRDTNHLFELSWTWYEDYAHWLFFHPNKTEQEFADDVKFLLRKYGDEFLQGNKGTWVGAYDWLKYISEKLVELGYEKAKLKSFNFFGGYILRGNDNSDDKWFEIIGEELAAKVIEHNTKVAQTLELPID